MLESARKHIERHHADADGLITLARKEDGRFHQEHFRMDEISAKLSEWIGEDVYFSQNTFYRPQRRVENVRQLRAVYVDVDHYLLNHSPDWVIGSMELELFGERVPDPNLIIHSGRGFVVVWFIEPVPGKKALPLWQAVESHFSQQFAKLGGDPKATDAARVFRIAGSTNSKNGAEVKVQYRHDHRYELRQLQADYLPELQPKRERKGRPSKSARLFNTYSLHYARLRDLSKLVELRGYNVKGYRETLCFLYRYWSCCFLADESEALQQTIEFNSEFTEPLRIREVEKATKSAEKAYHARNDKEANRLAQEKGYPGAGYNVTNETLIRWLDISEDEQRELQTIINAPEKRRRKADANREARRIESRNPARTDGEAPRSAYLAQQAGRTTDRIEALRKALEANPDASQRELAEAIGVSAAWVNILLKKGV
ncbi:replication protein [Cohnella lupini]|uniref:Replication protein n=1 Tax=Cohnella lupini TaxID=1294267 RepID=A0A3D9HNR6_9BACL|nr:replication protein [Cohnella lupini]RED51140.1 hypothetical protein DFP95_14711 [Cohnella lupini]